MTIRTVYIRRTQRQPRDPPSPMPYGGTAPLAAVALVSIAKLLPCDPGPKQAYAAFAEKAAEGKCVSVYNALDTDSRARLAAYLEVMVGMAFAAQDQAGASLPPLSEYKPGPQPLPAVTAALAALEEEKKAAEERDAGTTPAAGSEAAGSDEAGRTAPNPQAATQQDPQAATQQDPQAATQQDPQAAAQQDPEAALRALRGMQDKPEPTAAEQKAEQQKEILAALQTLRELQGKALWKALCGPDMPPLGFLFREAGVTDFIPVETRGEAIEGDTAELTIDLGHNRAATKKKKGKDKGDPDLPRPVIKLVKERGRWRLVLEPMALHWYATEDGRRVPRFNSPILSLGVETDAQRTPSHAYEQVVEYVRRRECERFYALLDSASQARMERVVPMMIGFASAIGSTRKQAAGPRDGRSLVIAMCQRASLDDLQASGLHLGTVEEETLHGNRAVLTVQSGADATREVMMIREAGEWRMSIDAFANPTGPSETIEEDDDEP